MATIKEVLHTTRTKFQKVDIVRLGPFGKTLILDDKTQSCEADEFCYHEALVHPSMLNSQSQRVLIAGGGEGATLREVLKHKSVKECVMVDIDEECVNFCRKKLESHHESSFDDPRAKFYYEDAMEYIKKYEKSGSEPFDVIILDLCDPVEDNWAYQLYACEFYESCKKILHPQHGILITQSGPAGILSSTECFTAINQTLNQVFPHVYPYSIHVPSFMDDYGFNMATQKAIDIKKVDTIDDRIESQIEGGSSRLRAYDAECHLRMFSLNKAVRTALKNESRVIKKDSYVFMK